MPNHQWQVKDIELMTHPDKPPQPHDVSEHLMPFMTLLQNGALSQRTADKAAQRVRGLHVIVTNTQVQLCTKARVKDDDDALELVKSFIDELRKVIEPGKVNTPAQRAAKGRGKRDRVMSPPGGKGQLTRATPVQNTFYP